jgi:hypothetical protein
MSVFTPPTQDIPGREMYSLGIISKLLTKGYYRFLLRESLFLQGSRRE